jgi:putative phosphoesterase
MPEVNIGVLSDTHNFLDPKVPALFAGVHHILHAGDIGLPGLLLELRKIAPVTAVSGNTDDPAFHFKVIEILELGGRQFLLQHIVNPFNPDDTLKARIARSRPAAIVFGHSHKPFCQMLGGVLFFNPGYCGRSRLGLARTVAILHTEADGIHPEFLPL